MPPAKLDVKKKPKKTVQLTEVVMVHEIDGQVCDTKSRTKHFLVLCKLLPHPLLLTFNNQALGQGAASEYARSDDHLSITRKDRTFLCGDDKYNPLIYPSKNT